MVTKFCHAWKKTFGATKIPFQKGSEKKKPMNLTTDSVEIPKGTSEMMPHYLGPDAKKHLRDLNKKTFEGHLLKVNLLYVWSLLV